MTRNDLSAGVALRADVHDHALGRQESALRVLRSAIARDPSHRAIDCSAFVDVSSEPMHAVRRHSDTIEWLALLVSFAAATTGDRPKAASSGQYLAGAMERFGSARIEVRL